MRGVQDCSFLCGVGNWQESVGNESRLAGEYGKS